MSAPTAYCPLCGCTGWHWDGCDNTAHTFDPGRLAAGKANPAQPFLDDPASRVLEELGGSPDVR